MAELFRLGSPACACSPGAASWPLISDLQLIGLLRVQHVILNHLYCQRNARGISATVVGATHRYKSKYVTTVLYKPQRRGGRSTPLGGDNGGSTPPMSD